MLWLMTLPNGLLWFHSITVTLRSQQYIELLSRYVVPTMKINLKGNFYFQQDNCSVHASRLVQQYLKDANIQTVRWASKSPDLNIVEDVWKIISDIVYDGLQFNNVQELAGRISNVIRAINNEKLQLIIDLYGSMRNRLCKVLIAKGNLCNC